MAETKYPIAKAPKGIKDETFRAVVSAAYSAYLHYGRIPSVAAIAKFCSHKPATISKVIQTSEFLWSMDRRGVRWNEKVQGLTPEQEYTLSVITNPTDRRDLTKKLKSCGVPYARYRAWLKQPLFSSHLNKVAESMLKEHQSDVHTSFLSQALSGNMNAIKFYYEMTGRHNPAQQQVIDLQRTVGMLLDIITRNVTDKEVLLKISSEIESALAGPQRALENSMPVNPIEDVIDAEEVPDFSISEKGVFDF